MTNQPHTLRRHALAALLATAGAAWWPAAFAQTPEAVKTVEAGRFTVAFSGDMP